MQVYQRYPYGSYASCTQAYYVTSMLLVVTYNFKYLYLQYRVHFTGARNILAVLMIDITRSKNEF